MQGNKVELTVDAQEFSQIKRSEIEGSEATLVYESSFGGRQTVSGTLSYNQRVFDRSRYQIDNREIDAGRVHSADGGRRVGEVVEITLTLDLKTAVEQATRHYNGHDIDDHGDQVVVQMWNGYEFERQNEKTLKVV